jgi:hypothetical protein
MGKRETSFGGPFVDPRVTDPAALKYQQQIQQRQGGPSRYAEPVGGGPTPPIPRLDMPHQEGMTMADQARAAQQPPPGSPDNIFPPMMQQPPAPPQRPAGPPRFLLPQDILPEAAKQDPDYREGAGSMYASAQPNLALKYGVIRNKVHIPPQKLTGGTGGLSDKTVEGLKAVEEFQRTRQMAENDEQGKKEERDAQQGPAGAAARMANAPGSQEERAEQLTEEDKQKVRQAINQMDQFDYNTFREMMMKDLLNNEEQRQIIEARVTEMDLDDLIMKGFVRQVVPIIPGKFEPEFKSISGEEDLALKRLIISEAKGFDVDDKYVLDKYSIMSVACGLFALNKKPLPDHVDNTGAFSDELFWKKFNMIVRYPLHMLASLGINFFWFDVRVRKMFRAEKLGNG